MIIEAALKRLGSRSDGRGRWQCPAHDDRTPSLSISVGSDGRALIRCHAGCDTERVVEALGLSVRDLFPLDSAATVQSRTNSRASANTSQLYTSSQSIRPDCTLAAYAEAKRLDLNFLKRLGVREVRYQGGSALRIPYLDEAGEEIAVRFRLHLESPEGSTRFKWRSGSKATLYGLHRLANAGAMGSVVLVEGESDCHTLWQHGIPALGIPGAGTWKAEWASAFDGLGAIFVVRETDKAGANLCKQLLEEEAIRNRLGIVDLGVKDVSALHIDDPDRFEGRFAEALGRSAAAAEEGRAAAEAERESRACASWGLCADLARSPRILDRVADELRARGLVGELRLAKLIYLAVTSRLLKKPVSLVAKGPSAAGKSYETERTIGLFPRSATYPLTAMSEHALAYSEEPLAHRMLVVYEAAGVEADFASYLLRSLLSEGCIRYETVQKTADGIQARLIERPGPTGAILTTTRLSLHPENETRLLSVPVDDSPEQTRRVLDALAVDRDSDYDDEQWHGLQEWLEAQSGSVVHVPFGSVLAQAVPPVAVRLRRDFGLLLGLIRAHALLHQASRSHDDRDRIVATLDDYAVVWELVADLIGEAATTTVSETIRQTVSAAATALLKGDSPEVTNASIAVQLGLDPSATSRRVRAAVAAGYLENRETRRGRPSRIVLGEALPEDRPLLPTPDELAKRWQSCAGPLCEDAQSPSARISEENVDRLHDCRGAERWTDRQMAPLAPGPLRDEFEELAAELIRAGMDENSAEREAAERLGLMISDREERRYRTH